MDVRANYSFVVVFILLYNGKEKKENPDFLRLSAVPAGFQR
jgi:hypothetical protein